MSQVRDQLHTLTLDEVTATQFKTVLNRLFLDASQRAEAHDGKAMVNSWQATHLPAYGQCIPQSAVVTRAQGGEIGGAGEPVLSPTGQEVYEVQAIVLSANNTPTTDAQVDVFLTDSNTGDTLFFAPNVAVSPNGFTNAFDLTASPFTMDSNMTLKWRVDSAGGGSASDIRIVTYHFLRSQ